MKRILLSLTCVMAASTGFAQQALSWGKAPLASPVVNADNTVTFNIAAPEAQKVEITGRLSACGKGENISWRAGNSGAWSS